MKFTQAPLALHSRDELFIQVHSEFTMKKLPDRFFAEHVVVISGQADGPLILLKWVDGKLVVVKPPPEPDPRFKEFSSILGMLNTASHFDAHVSSQIAHALQPMVEQHLSNVLG